MSGKPLRMLGIEIDLSGKKAKDDLAEWNRELRAAKGFSEDFTEGVDDMAREMMEHAKAIGISGEKLKEIQEITRKNREIDDFAKKYGLQAKVIKEVGEKAAVAEKKVAGLKGVMGGLAAIGIGTAIKSIGGEMLDLARQAEQSQIQFEVMLKSPEKAKETLNMLKEFSDVTPFSDTEAIAAGKQLINAKVPLDQLKQTLLEIGDVAAGSGVAFGELAEIYSKNKMSGLIQLEDVNQLAGRGIPIMDELAKVMGVGSDQIRSLTSSGAIKFEHLRQAFANMSKEGGTYSGMMDKLSLSGAGLASTFDSKLAAIKRTMGGVLEEGMKPLLTVGIKFLDWLLKSETAMAVLKASLFVIIPVVGTLLAAALWTAAAAAWGLIAPLLPIIGIVALVGAAILGLILIFEDLYVFFTGGDSVIGEYFQRLKLQFLLVKLYVYGIISDVLDFFKSIPDKVVSFFKLIPDRIMSVLSGIKEKLKNLIPAPVMNLLVKTGFLEDKKQVQARAKGGDINAGDEYIVGEKGPELFRSDRAGTIIPNHALGGGRKITNITLAPVFNISGVPDPKAVTNLVMKDLENVLPLVAAELGFGLD